MLSLFKKNTVVFSLALATLFSILILPGNALAQQQRGFFSRHRTPVTIVGGTLAGAGIGGLAGGRKGALIGAAVGAGGSTIFEIVRTKRDRDRQLAYYQRRTAENRYNNCRPRYSRSYRY